MTTDASADLERYLRRLDRGLASLPGQDRKNIVEETRSHVRDGLEHGASVESVLADLGPPEAYALRFVEDAAADPQSEATARALPRRLGRGARAVLTVSLVALMVVIAGAAVVTCFLKPFDPHHVGLWIGPSDFVFGRVRPGSGDHEVLGDGLYPVAVLLVVAAWFLSPRILSWGLRKP